VGKGEKRRRQRSRRVEQLSRAAAAGRAWRLARTFRLMVLMLGGPSVGLPAEGEHEHTPAGRPASVDPVCSSVDLSRDLDHGSSYHPEGRSVETRVGGGRRSRQVAVRYTAERFPARSVMYVQDLNEGLTDGTDQVNSRFPARSQCPKACPPRGSPRPSLGQKSLGRTAVALTAVVLLLRPGRQGVRLRRAGRVRSRRRRLGHGRPRLDAAPGHAEEAADFSGIAPCNSAFIGNA